MGCDIHPCVEVTDENGKWKAVGDPENAGSFEWDFGRNYCSFAVMAGVRNSYEMRPISEPRGLPKDVTKHVACEISEEDPNLHSHSWLLLSEILAYDLDQVVQMEGWVSVREFKQFQKNGEPSSYCGGVGGGDVRHISNDDMRRIVKDGPYSFEKGDFYTLLHWQKKYKDEIPALLRFVEQIKKLGDPDKIRIVFAFDN
jgi:hypothetical protein